MRRAVVIAATACAALVGSAAAEAFVIAAPPQAVTNGFITPRPVIFEGGSLTFANFDLVDHTVTSATTETTGFPSWGSDAAGFGETEQVRGVERLAPGQYGFICIFHPDITGTLTVVPRDTTTIKGGTK